MNEIDVKAENERLMSDMRKMATKITMKVGLAYFIAWIREENVNFFKMWLPFLACRKNIKGLVV